MADDTPAPQIETQDLYDELYTAFASTWGGSHPDKMARALMRLDDTHDVVALTTDGFESWTAFAAS